MLAKHSRPSQCARIEAYIKDFGSITQLEALKDLGVMRLASRISEIRKRGLAIGVEMKSGMNRYGESVRYAVYKIEQ